MVQPLFTESPRLIRPSSIIGHFCLTSVPMDNQKYGCLLDTLFLRVE